MDLLSIEPKDTYFLGYIVDSELKQRETDKEFNQKVKDIRERGSTNHEIYLDYDHMDVYIATSMREKLDFWNVARFARELQDQKAIRDLRLRFFDPTQAYCPDRIDKGLVEGLMLKRAKCTIYLAGETETLGKDSELAATLAQGKTVIAYVPRLDSLDEFKANYVEKVFGEVYPQESRMEIALKFLQIFWPEGAWTSEKTRNWIQSRDESLADEVIHEIYTQAGALYEKRAKTLKDIHPLGLQVNLQTGVANGVLVARTIPECADLLKKVILKQLEFRLEKKGSVFAAVETSTSSIFRMVTEDAHLTNSFWNFYFGGK